MPHAPGAARYGPATIMVLVLVLGACVAQGPQAQGPQAPSAATPAATATPSMPPDELVVIQATTIDSMDPHIANRDDARVILRRIAQPLVLRDPETLQPSPGLAVSWRQPDPRTWEFSLREGVRFTNGEPFTAQTVKFNFDRILNEDLGSVLRATFANLLAGVEVVDERTVRLLTKEPYAMMLERLTTVLMVPEKLVVESGDAAYGAHPVGTGPYKFVEWATGQSVTLERNDDYWGPRPYFQRVVYRQIQESSTAIAELLSGGAHVVTIVPPDQEEAIKSSGVADVISRPATNVLELRMDPLARTSPNPFEDKRVRHAVHYAVNRQAIADKLLGGYTEPVATSIVPGMFGHDPSIEPRPYDPDRARELLAEAGYPDGFEVRFLWYPVSNWRGPKQIVEAIAADLAAVGIRTELFSVGATEISSYTNPGRAGPLYIGNNSNGGFYDGGFGFFYLRERFSFAYYWSDELEEMIVTVETSTDPKERKRVLYEIQALLHEEAPYLWLFHGFDLVGARKGLDLSKALVGPDFVVEAIEVR